MIDFNFENECYSCSACKTVCKANAISFNEQLFPVIEKQKCIQCGACNRVCIRENEIDYRESMPEDSIGFACKNKDNDIRIHSSSGGVFYALAKHIINIGGVVCGCMYDNNFMPKHTIINEISEISRLMGSKYVKSDLGNCISEMKSYLKNGIPVLFSGVPCQIAAVRNVLGDAYENLYLCAVVCHGSIERDIWRNYLKQEQNRGNIISVSMRNKEQGWLDYGLEFLYEDGSRHITFRKSNGYFLKCFTEGVLQRSRCLSCNYKGTNINADILLGDGWGIDKIYPEMVDNIGISSVICLTIKGKTLFSSCRDEFDQKEIMVSQIVDSNQRIIKPALHNSQREVFISQYNSEPHRIQEICENIVRSEFTMKNRILKKVYRLFQRR